MKHPILNSFLKETLIPENKFSEEKCSEFIKKLSFKREALEKFIMIEIEGRSAEG